MADDVGAVQESMLSKVFAWIAAIVGGAFAIVILYQLIQMGKYGFWDQVALEHMASIIGLPCAAIASLVIVLILRTVAGRIELKLYGLELRGASGPIVMWVLCFLAITLAIRETWSLKSFDGAIAPSHFVDHK
jgi:hypothetical protein